MLAWCLNNCINAKPLLREPAVERLVHQNGATCKKCEWASSCQWKSSEIVGSECVGFGDPYLAAKHTFFLLVMLAWLTCTARELGGLCATSAAGRACALAAETSATHSAHLGAQGLRRASLGFLCAGQRVQFTAL